MLFCVAVVLVLLFFVIFGCCFCCLGLVFVDVAPLLIIVCSCWFVAVAVVADVMF
jgi:hypothetical protein